MSQNCKVVKTPLKYISLVHLSTSSQPSAVCFSSLHLTNASPLNLRSTPVMRNSRATFQYKAIFFKLQKIHDPYPGHKSHISAVIQSHWSIILLNNDTVYSTYTRHLHPKTYNDSIKQKFLLTTIEYFWKDPTEKGILNFHYVSIVKYMIMRYLTILFPKSHTNTRNVLEL